MLKVVLALCGLVAMVTADCSLIEKQVIKSQWSHAYGIGLDREHLGEEVWEEIFHEVPESRALFDRVHGEDIHSKQFKAHSSRVLTGLDMCVGLLDDTATLQAQLAHLKAQHIERKIPDAYFEAMKHALVKVLPRHLQCFNQPAWEHCLDELNSAIKGGS